MTLVVLKHGGQWDVLAQLFHMKGPNFERQILKFFPLTIPLIYDRFVFAADVKFNIEK